MRKPLYFFIITFMMPFGLSAQIAVDNVVIPKFDPSFERFELPGGALGNSVQGIVQDSVGYMWFASQGGLHRFDGQNIITYNTDPNNPNTLNSDYVEDIYLDSQGIIWLTHWTGGGVTSYDPDKGVFKRYVHDADDPQSILGGETASIVEDAQGYIWVGGSSGLSRLDREKGLFKRFVSDPNDPSTLSDNDIRGLYVDKEGILWVATGMPWDQNELGGLNRYYPETQSFERFMHDPDDPTSISNNKVRAMFEDSRGNFWVGTAGDGFHRFNKKDGTFDHFSYDPEDPNKLFRPYLHGSDPSEVPFYSHITSIFEDNNQRIWITAVEGGLDVYDFKTGTKSHFERGPDPEQLKTNFIWQTYQSDDGTIWLATGGEGRELYKVKQAQLTFPFFKTSMLDNDSTSAVRGIVKDSNGHIWIGKMWNYFTPNVRSGVRRLDMDRRSITEVPISSEHGNSDINGFMGSLTMDRSGNIWVGTEHGYFTSAPNNSRLNAFRPEIIADNNFGVPKMFQSKDGYLWIPVWEVGILRYHPETKVHEIFKHDPQNPNSIAGIVAWAVHEANNGDMWIGGGTPWQDPNFPLFLDRYDSKTGKFEHFIDGKIISGVVFDMVEDFDQQIWFLDGSDGLFKLDPIDRQLRRLTPYNSLLPGGDLFSISIAADGQIWIGGKQVLIELDPKTETMSIYNEKHGIRPVNDLSYGSGSVTEDGELLFARQGGFHIFDPQELLSEVKSKLPDLRITGFRLLDERTITGATRLEESILSKPIWKTDLIELQSDENIFAFSVACFDFYEPEANQLQFMLEGYDLGWRQDIREGETPSYINVPPGEYTFRLRGANSLGVWNKEGISLKVTIHPPWWKTWWAYACYALILVAGIFSLDRFQRRRLLRKEREKNQQRELEQAREVSKAYKELKDTQTQLIHSEKMASLGELTAGIAHEIQNPLNFVNNFSDVNSELIDELKQALKNGDLNEVEEIATDIGENEKKIVHHGKRAEGIVKSMLQHSRGTEGKKEPTDLNALADEYLRLAFHGMRAKDKSFNSEMETDFDQDIGQVMVVPQDIGRVLLNLITNAFHALSQRQELDPNGYQPRIKLITSKENGVVKIRVNDNGVGIPESLRKKVFEPFFSTKGTGKGTGLGLSLSYDIITKGHGGAIEVQSEEGTGTEFIITLPNNT